MRQYRSSGISGASPPFLRMRKILLPVTCETWAMPCESRRMTPICEGVRPFFASLQTCSTTSEGEVFSHEGGVRRYGRADLEIPLPLLCMRPMVGASLLGEA